MDKTRLSQEEWRRVEEVHHEALEHRPEPRSAFVTAACGSEYSHSRLIAPFYQFAGLALDYALTRSWDGARYTGGLTFSLSSIRVLRRASPGKDKYDRELSRRN